MKVCKSVEDMTHHIQSWKNEGMKISFVPTMGYLHKGHEELMKYARMEGSIVIVSIFLNPAQFNNLEDLERYPIDIEGDLVKCKKMNVDCVFLPDILDIYPKGIPKINIHIPHLMNVLCGKSRPGHFEGVLIVLSRLFNIIQPDVLFMGKKDYQQLKIVSYFIESLGYPITIYGVETVREPDGLAMSSRNVRLSAKEREAATLIHRMMNIAEKVYNEGEKNIDTFKDIMLDVLASNSLIQIDYLEIVDTNTLENLYHLQDQFLIAIAVYCGNVRLIDNREIS